MCKLFCVYFMLRTISLINNNRTTIPVESWCDFSCFPVRYQLKANCLSNVARLFVERQPIVCRTSANCLSNVSQLFVERRTIVCRTSHDCLSNVAQLFVERRTMGRVWIDSSNCLLLKSLVKVRPGLRNCLSIFSQLYYFACHL